MEKLKIKGIQYIGLGFLKEKAAKDKYNKGCELAKQERYDEALKAFDKATKLDPKNPMLW